MQDASSLVTTAGNVVAAPSAGENVKSEQKDSANAVANCSGAGGTRATAPSETLSLTDAQAALDASPPSSPQAPVDKPTTAIATNPCHHPMRGRIFLIRLGVTAARPERARRGG